MGQARPGEIVAGCFRHRRQSRGAPEVPSAMRLAALHYRLFVIAWSIMTAIQTIANNRWELSVGHFAVSLFTFALAISNIFEPTSRGRFVAQVVAQVAAEVYALPVLPNHVMLLIVADLALVMVFASEALRRRKASSDGASEFLRFSPILRWLLVMTYAAAVLHKLNKHFFSPEVSCGFRLLRMNFGEDAPSWMQWPSIVGGIGTEILLPFLFCVRRARGLVIPACVVFHAMLTFNEGPQIRAFSAAVVALALLFAPAPMLRALSEWLAAPSPWLGRRRIRIVVCTLLVLAASVGAFRATQRGTWVNVIAEVLGPVERLAWGVWACVLAAGCIVLVRRTTREDVRGKLDVRTSPATAAVCLLLFAANALSPYLGLKTATNFSMFSNLRTEDGRNNHLFMGNLHLLGYEDDLVEVLDTSNRGVKNLTRGDASRWRAYQGVPPVARRQVSERGGRPPEPIPGGYLLSFFQLRAYLAEDPSPDLFVVYVRDGKTIRVSRRETPDHPVLEPPHWLARKLLMFRPVPKDRTAGPCQW